MYKNYRAWEMDKLYLIKVYSFIKEISPLNKIKTTLDIGCADGSFSAKLRRDFGFDVYGVDISDNAILKAIEKGVKAQMHNLEYQLPYPDSFFDLVFACEVIEHIYDTDFVISEMNRVLKNNGLLIISTPNIVSLSNRIRILFGKYPNYVTEYRAKDGAGHIRTYSIPVLINQLKEHEFMTLKKSSSHIAFPMANKFIPFFLKKIAIKLGDIFPRLGTPIIIVAKKRTT